MKSQLDEDNFLRIQLLSYDRPTGQTERFYFLEMSTLQATTLLQHDMAIISCKVFAYSDDQMYVDEKIISDLKTVGDFNAFFLKNPEYYIHDCEIELEGKLSVSSHDDGEVSIQFLIDGPDSFVINKIFERYALDKKLIEILKDKPGHFIAIGKESNIEADFETFDDYVKNRPVKN